MSEDRTARNFVAWSLIAQDLEFSTRLVSSLQEQPDVAWLVSYGVTPYLSMFIYETYSFLQKEHSEIADMIQLSEYPTIRSSRHSVKLLDDPNGIDQLAAFFKTDVVAHFENLFSPPNNPIGWFFRPFYNDLGLYYYAGNLVNTTHVASFELGINRGRLRAGNSEDVLAIYEEYGRFLSIMGHGITKDAESFVGGINAKQITWKNAKSRSYYPRHFDSNPISYENGLNCLLTALQANLAFLNLLVDIPSDPQSAPSLCKIHLICAVHVLASCAALLASHRDRLDRRSIAVLEAITQDGGGPKLRSRQIKFLRNALMHYLPHGDFHFSDLKPDAIYCGLIEKYCPEFSFLDILTLSVSEVRRLGELVTCWSERLDIGQK